MKKYILLFTLISAFAVFPKLIYSQGVQQRINISPSPTGNEIQNQIQNQGEEQQIQTQEQENQENATGEGSQNRNQNAVQNMSEVAKYVQQLQQIRTTGGIGDQVRQVAREQIQATIQALMQENTTLQERISAEEQTKSLFGWLVNLYNK